MWWVYNRHYNYDEVIIINCTVKKLYSAAMAYSMDDIIMIVILKNYTEIKISISSKTAS